MLSGQIFRQVRCGNPIGLNIRVLLRPNGTAPVAYSVPVNILASKYGQIAESTGPHALQDFDRLLHQRRNLPVPG